MKKAFAILTLLLIVIAASAKKNILLHTDKGLFSYPIETIDSITFIETISEGISLFDLFDAHFVQHYTEFSILELISINTAPASIVSPYNDSTTKVSLELNNRGTPIGSYDSLVIEYNSSSQLVFIMANSSPDSDFYQIEELFPTGQNRIVITPAVFGTFPISEECDVIRIITDFEAEIETHSATFYDITIYGSSLDKPFAMAP